MTEQERNAMNANINNALQRTGATPSQDTSGKPASASKIAEAADRRAAGQPAPQIQLPDALKDAGKK